MNKGVNFIHSSLRERILKIKKARQGFTFFFNLFIYFLIFPMVLLKHATNKS